jgi:hypothetical protein
MFVKHSLVAMHFSEHLCSARSIAVRLPDQEQTFHVYAARIDFKGWDLARQHNWMSVLRVQLLSEWNQHA